jgi:adenine/guanine phosphoribosyltransferase-like PRPP-binding protein
MPISGADRLLEGLLSAGLIQFGRFAGANGFDPLRLHLELLPSYPQVLADAARTLEVITADCRYDFIIAAPDALATATAMSQRLGLPLVYSRGRGETPTHDLVGAYDVGHPALLVSLIHDDERVLDHLMRSAASVGLETVSAAALIDLGSSTDVTQRPRRSVWTLRGLIDELIGQGIIPPDQAATVREWLTRRRPG